MYHELRKQGRAKRSGQGADPAKLRSSNSGPLSAEVSLAAVPGE